MTEEQPHTATARDADAAPGREPGPGRPGPGPGAAATPGAGPGDGLGAGPDARPGATPDSGAVPASRGFATPHRSRRQKVFAGVCGGLGRELDLDPVIFRIVLSVLAVAGGLGLIFYGIAWLLLSYDDEEENEFRRLLTGRVEGTTLAAMLTTLVGCGLFLSMLNNPSVMYFAVVLCGATAAAAYWSQQRRVPVPDGAGTTQPTGPRSTVAPPETQAPPVPGAPSWWRDPIVKHGLGRPGGTGYLWGPEGAVDFYPSDVRPDARGQVHGHRFGHGGGLRIGYVPDLTKGGHTVPSRPPGPGRPHRPTGIGGRVFLLAALAFALGTGPTWDDKPLGTSLETGFAAALAVFGLGIAVSSLLGRTGAGSVVLGLITAGLLTASVAVPNDVTTHWVRTEWHPATVAQVLPEYRLGSGDGLLDLGKVDIGAGRTAAVRVDLGAGRVRVIVPRNATVRMDISMRLGNLRLPPSTDPEFGRPDFSVDLRSVQHDRQTLPPADTPTTSDTATTTAGAEEQTRTLELELQVGIGQVEVIHAAS